MGLVDNVSRNLFAKAKKGSAYDKHFVVATISKTRDSLKQLLQNKMQTVQKLKIIIKLNSPSNSANRLFAPQVPI